VEARLPEQPPPAEAYDLVLSNSLLHHLPDPAILWQAVARWARLGAGVFVMDLLRPASPEAARALMEQYAAGEPEVLRHDFHHSLLAAYRPDEVREQLRQAGLEALDLLAVSDRHWIVFGRR
jgi:2-polyprenyl-3-methyl-5-hydroxy-6-metoxy-1,4-benzoquinol methylase